MVIYVKNKNGTITEEPIKKIIQTLCTMAKSSETPAHIIGFDNDLDLHFLFTMQNTLHRFRIYETRTTDFLNTTTIKHSILPGYHTYDMTTGKFSPTPTPGKFASSPDFSLNINQLLTQDEIAQYCPKKTQIISISSNPSANHPPLPQSKLTKEQQKILYFNKVLHTCDRFHQTLLTINDNFDHPEKILIAVISNDTALSTLTLTPIEKKFIESSFLPFFQPEQINTISEITDATITDVIDFYTHCIKLTLENNNHKINTLHERKYPEEIKHTKVGALASNYSTDTLYWRTESSEEKHLSEANFVIFEFIYIIFGIQTQHESELHTFIEKQMEIQNRPPYLEDIINALKDYQETLKNEDNQLHFSPRYQTAYSNISAAFPMPEDNVIKKKILEKIEATIDYLTLYPLRTALIHAAEPIVTVDNFRALTTIPNYKIVEILKKNKALLLSETHLPLLLSTLRKNDELIKLIRSSLMALPLELTNNTAGFYEYIVNHGSAEENIIVLTELPGTMELKLLTKLAQDNQLSVLTSDSFQYTSQTNLEKMEANLVMQLHTSITTAETLILLAKIFIQSQNTIMAALANKLPLLIKTAQHFNGVFSLLYFTEKKTYIRALSEKIDLSRLTQTTLDFQFICSTLEKDQRKKFCEKMFDELPSLIKDISELSKHILHHLSEDQQTLLINNLKNHLSDKLIQSELDIINIFSTLSSKQINLILPETENCIKKLIASNTFNTLFFSIQLTNEKKIMLCSATINLRNKINQQTSNSSLFSNTPNINATALLGALHLIYNLYFGIAKEKLQQILIQFKSIKNPDTTTILDTVKTAILKNEFNDPDLHTTLEMVIKAFESNLSLNTAHLTNQLKHKTLCCC